MGQANNSPALHVPVNRNLFHDFMSFLTREDTWSSFTSFLILFTVIPIPDFYENTETAGYSDTTTPFISAE